MSSELCVHLPPTSRPTVSPRRGRSSSALSRAATSSFNAHTDNRAGSRLLLQVFIVHLRIIKYQDYNTNSVTQVNPEMLPTRPAAPISEMVPRPAAVREAPSPDGRVLSCLASTW